MMKKSMKSKHKSKVAPGFFFYRAIKARYLNVNPEIEADYINEDLKEKLREIVARHKDFCEEYCTKEFWKDSFEGEPCFLRLVKKKLNELHVSKSTRGKFKCHLYDEIC